MKFQSAINHDKVIRLCRLFDEEKLTIPNFKMMNQRSYDCIIQLTLLITRTGNFH